MNSAVKQMGAAGCGMPVDKTATNHDEGLTVLSNELRMAALVRFPPRAIQLKRYNETW